MDHPIGSMMQTTMESLRNMVDVNTVVGDPMTGTEGATIIPISRVSFGFVAGGGEYADVPAQKPISAYPFAGGSGAGVSVQPVGFLVVTENSVRMLPAVPVSPVDRAMELLPQVAEDIKALFKKKEPDKKERDTAFTTPTNHTMGGAPLDTRQLYEGVREANSVAEKQPER